MTPSTTLPIRLDMTMAEIQDKFPSARRALFQRYHIGGCSSCAYQLTDTLAKVCKDHNILDVDGVVQHLLRSHEVDQLMQAEPTQVRAWIAAGEPLYFIDLRPPGDAASVPVAEAEPLDFANQHKYMQLPKDARIVFPVPRRQRVARRGGVLRGSRLHPGVRGEGRRPGLGGGLVERVVTRAPGSGKSADRRGNRVGCVALHQRPVKLMLPRRPPAEPTR
jgi:hypothetical protein